MEQLPSGMSFKHSKVIVNCNGSVNKAGLLRTWTLVTLMNDIHYKIFGRNQLNTRENSIITVESSELLLLSEKIMIIKESSKLTFKTRIRTKLK